MYKFRDVTAGTVPSDFICSEEISLNGEYIRNSINGYQTLSVSGRESLEYDISEVDRPMGTDGMEYYGKRQKGRMLTIRFVLSAPSAAEFMRRYRQLKNICKGEDRMIRFADEPNAHYTGTLQSIDTPDPGLLSVVSEMTFYCADPYLVSDVITSVAATREGDKLVARVDNDSSGMVFPVYRIKHKTENGYIGIVHTGGAFEMGNIEDADGETYQESEMLFMTDDGDFSGWEPYTTTTEFPQNNKVACNGTLKIADRHRPSGDDWAMYKAFYLDNPGSQTAGCDAYGGCRRLTLPPDSTGQVGAKDFYLWFQCQFMTGALGQTGHLQIAIADEENKLIAAFAVSKTDKTGNTAYARFYYGVPPGTPGAAWSTSTAFKTMYFQPTIYKNQNPFVLTGYEDIMKTGSKLRFFFWGGYHEVDVPELKDKKVKYVYVFVGQHRDCPKRTTIMNVGKIHGTKMNVDKWRDVPNRYVINSEVVINCEDDSITLNGMPANDEMVTGSAFYPLPPGETEIEFYTSSWCAALPDVTVEFRKRWL